MKCCPIGTLAHRFTYWSTTPLGYISKFQLNPNVFLLRAQNFLIKPCDREISLLWMETQGCNELPNHNDKNEDPLVSLLYFLDLSLLS